MEFLRRTWAEINLSNLLENLNMIKKTVDPAYVMATVKADAYGHGAVEVASAFVQNGVRWLSVSNLDEALELRENHIGGDILILGYTPLECAPILSRWNLTQTVYSLSYAQQLSDAARQNKIRVHLKLDTGMSRIGFVARDLQKCLFEIECVYQLKNLQVTGIFSHLCHADEPSADAMRYTQLQITRFENVLNSLKSARMQTGLSHLQNSAGILTEQGRGFSMVRPGIILYGLHPSKQLSEGGFKPVLSLKTVISMIKELPAGECVGYGRTFTTTRPTRLATLPIGYADGYFRSLSNCGSVLIRGKRARIVGNICMDQMMVDVTDIPVEPDDEVTLIGDSLEETITADEIAQKIGTIGYEVVCSISRRVPRIFIENGVVVRVKRYL